MSGMRIISKSVTGGGDDYALAIRSSDGIEFRAAGNILVADTASVFTKLPKNRWVHIAGVYNGSTMSIYMDGDLRRSVAHSGNITASGDPMGIGGHATDGNRFFPGLIDEVAVWNRALPASEIHQIYEVHTMGYELPANLLAHYKLNEAPASNTTAIRDSSYL